MFKDQRKRRLPALASAAVLVVVAVASPSPGPASAEPTRGADGGPAVVSPDGDSVFKALHEHHESGPTVPSGFEQTAAISGLTEPTAVAFAPDGKVFIGDKAGVIKVWSSLDDTRPEVFADLRTEVYNGWDRGLIGLAVDPKFPRRPFVYALYTYDALPGGTAPRWNDVCPSPPGYTEDGCVVTNRISQLTVGRDGTVGKIKPLVTDWCQQYPSHSADSLVFGEDGALYASAGEGASFVFADYGQRGNPCADPPGRAGENLTAPDARGGSLRAQSPRRPENEPRVLNGTVIRIDPDTGQGLAGNPYFHSRDANARRIYAYGLRNPFRITPRPGTGEIWAGDVGEYATEEINRITRPKKRGAAQNFGWPCFEGASQHPSIASLKLTACESLYAAGGDSKPFFEYPNRDKVGPADTCPVTGGASVSGLAFERKSKFPAAYRGALFFSDSTRGCVWALPKGPGGLPDKSKLTTFVTGASAPVQLLFGPGNDLYYLAMESGELRRITYTGDTNRAPDAVATATPASGNSPLTVHFDGTGSTDPDGDQLTYAWDTDGDGAFDDGAQAVADVVYPAKQYVRAALKVTDPKGRSAVAEVDVVVDGAPSPDPVPVITSPTAQLTWQVGQKITFSGTASDAQDGQLPASALSWQLVMRHCSLDGNCHSHTIETFDGVAGGEAIAPDHPYPSHLELTLSARDQDGHVGTRTIELQPKTVELTFDSDPPQIPLIVGAYGVMPTPYTTTAIVGSAVSVTASSPIPIPGADPYFFRFVNWSDGGGSSHVITAPAEPTTYVASYEICPCE